jgi:hypothetical protein
MALTFAYRLKKSVIYENVSTEKVTSDSRKKGYLEFNGLQILDSQNSKGKYESRKII